MTRNLILSFCITSVALFGCRKSPPRDAQVAAPPSRGHVAPLSDEASRLCLLDPAGDSPVDRKLREFQRQARALPNKADAWLQVGRSWVRKARLSSDPGFYLNVDRCAQVALRVTPDYHPALGLRGLVLMNGHKFDEARKLAERVLHDDPVNLMALTLHSDALLELGRFTAATEALQRLMDIKPGPAGYARASYLRWLQGDAAGAKSFIRQALESGRDARDPEFAAWIFVQAGMLFWNEADYDGADAVFAEALKWVPDYPAALCGRGRVALSQKRPDQAIPLFEKAYARDPLPETAWLLGDAREMRGDSTGAREAYDRVVKIGRGTDRLTLALFYATKDHDHDEALRLIEEERQGRGGVYVEDTYAWALYRAGRLAEALQAIDRGARLGTNDARLLYHAGAIRMASGDASGRKLVARALALHPGFDMTGAAEAAGLLGKGLGSPGTVAKIPSP